MLGQKNEKGGGGGEKKYSLFSLLSPRPLPHCFWFAPFSPLFSSFKMVLSQAKHLPTWRKRLHCRLNRNQSESITRIDNFSTFQSHDIHLLALLGPFTGPNDRFPYTFIHFILWNPPGGVLPYMGYMGMCRCEGYSFQAVYSRMGYINQSVWV